MNAKATYKPKKEDIDPAALDRWNHYLDQAKIYSRHLEICEKFGHADHAADNKWKNSKAYKMLGIGKDQFLATWETAKGYNADPAVDQFAHLANLTGFDRMLIEMGAELMPNHQLAVPELSCTGSIKDQRTWKRKRLPAEPTKTDAPKDPGSLPKAQDPDFIAMVAQVTRETALDLIKAFEQIQPDFNTLRGILRDIRQTPAMIFEYLKIANELGEVTSDLAKETFTGYTAEQVYSLSHGSSFGLVIEDEENPDENADIEDKEPEAFAFTYRFFDREHNPARERYSDKWQAATAKLQSLTIYKDIKALASNIMAYQNKTGKSFESYPAAATFWAIYRAKKKAARNKLINRSPNAQKAAKHILALTAEDSSNKWAAANRWIYGAAKQFIGDAEIWEATKDLFYSRRDACFKKPKNKTATA
jgi:hypothetical protein